MPTCLTVIKWWGLIAVPLNGPNCPSYCQPLPVSGPVGAAVFAVGSAVRKSVTAVASGEAKINAVMIAIGKARRVMLIPNGCRFLAQSYKNYKNRVFWTCDDFFLCAFSLIRGGSIENPNRTSARVSSRFGENRRAHFLVWFFDSSAIGSRTNLAATKNLRASRGRLVTVAG